LISSNFSCDRIENTEGAIKKKDNRKKLATLGTQDEKKKQKKNTTQYLLGATMRKQTQIT